MRRREAGATVGRAGDRQTLRVDRGRRVACAPGHVHVAVVLDRRFATVAAQDPEADLGGLDTPLARHVAHELAVEAVEKLLQVLAGGRRIGRVQEGVGGAFGALWPKAPRL